MKNPAFEKGKESVDKGIYYDDIVNPVSPREKQESVTGIDLDNVLINELGQFGRFALRTILLISIPILTTGFNTSYIFSAAAIPHRCQIQECGEYHNLHDYKPEWILNAVPEMGSGLSSCQRYAPNSLSSNGTLDFCPINIFNQSAIVRCETFVYARNNTVVYDFNLGCKEWLRALAGTFTSIGSLIALPIIGVISDRFGRKIALVISIFNVALFGLLKAFSVNYTMFLILQMLHTILGGAMYSTAYVFAAELVGPKYRVLVSATCATMVAIGHIILGVVAWLIQPWRYMLMVLYIPVFLFISYYFILPESVRWLLSKKKYKEARKVLLDVARVNKTHITEKSLKALLTSTPDTATKYSNSGLVRKIIKSPTLLRRVCTTPIWWITSTLVYYGLSINSTRLSDTMYLNYILTSAIEIPGSLTAVFVLDRVGRRVTFSFTFFFAGACNFAFIFIPKDLTALRLIVFLLGKFGSAVMLMTAYLYTSELYPTEFRHTLLAFSSMIGRIGSIAAPLTPVLAEYWEPTPSLLFGGMAILSGFLVLTQPETRGTKLPETLAEAEMLGKK